jgi:L-ascorbate metabolism protein UlaG (beta-lactamase superfamily)
MLEDALNKLMWLGHDGFLYLGPPVIYFNPYEFHFVRPADIILIGHEHFHHHSWPDIKKVWRQGTAIVTDKSAERHIEWPVISMEPGETITVKDTPIEAVPAYNLDTSYHPRSKGYLGYIVTVDGLRIYHAGDTDFIPEMRDLRVDIALLPISGLHKMNATQAAEAALALKPQVVIPMDYENIQGRHADAENFRSLLAGKLRVEILARS